MVPEPLFGRSVELNRIALNAASVPDFKASTVVANVFAEFEIGLICGVF